MADGFESFEGFAVSGGGLFSDYMDKDHVTTVISALILGVFLVAMMVLLYEVFSNAGSYKDMVVYPCYALVAALAVSLVVDMSSGKPVGTSATGALPRPQ